METPSKSSSVRWFGSATVLLAMLALGTVVVRAAIVRRPAAHKPAGVVGTAPERFKIPVTDSQPAKGNPDALITIIEWSDLRCVSCAGVEPVVDQVMKRYGDKVRVIWRNYPKTENADALPAAELAMEAHTQGGKFWQARALLLQHPERLDEATLQGFAQPLGLDERAVASALKQHSHGPHLANDGFFAQAFGVTDLPAFFINGVRLHAPLSLEHFSAAIDAELPRAQQVLARGVAAANVYDELTKDGLWKAADSDKLASGL